MEEYILRPGTPGTRHTVQRFNFSYFVKKQVNRLPSNYLFMFFMLSLVYTYVNGPTLHNGLASKYNILHIYFAAMFCDNFYKLYMS